MSEQWRCEIENDGPRYRWVLMWGERRIAKGAAWWDSEEDAMADYDNFCTEIQRAQEPK